MNNHRPPRPYIQRDKSLREVFVRKESHRIEHAGMPHADRMWINDEGINEELRNELRGKPPLLTIRRSFDHIDYLDDDEVLHAVYICRIKDVFYAYVYRSDTQLFEFSSWDAFGDKALRREVFGTYDALLEFIKDLWSVDRFDVEIRKNIDHQNWFYIKKNDKGMFAPRCIADTLGHCLDTRIPTEGRQSVTTQFVVDKRGGLQPRPNEEAWVQATEDGFSQGLILGRYKGLTQALDLARKMLDHDEFVRELEFIYNGMGEHRYPTPPERPRERPDPHRKISKTEPT